MNTRSNPGVIIWSRDLEDDCIASWNGLNAHAEHMDKNHWYCSVWTDAKELLHSTSDDICPLSGEAARLLCELVMRAYFAGVEIKSENQLYEEAKKEN